MKKIIVVQGPTASGKSDLALKIAKDFNGFLISADSRMVYRGMDIGTNKDPGQWVDGKFLIEGVEEFMIDVVEPNEEFSVDEWVKQVKELIEKDDRLPIIVGGTNLYLESLVYNYKLPVGKNVELRENLEKEVEADGLESLVEKIKKIDPKIEEKIDVKNPRRVVRAAEICFQTNEPLEYEKGEAQYEVLQVGITKDREVLYSKINKRVDEMVDEGLVEEVKGLNDKFGCDIPSMTGIGYRQICQYLNEGGALEVAVDLVKRDTRRYAKRQLTWLKRDKTIHWVEKYDEAKEIVEKFV